MTTNEKLSMLREKMAEAGVQAYLIPSSDPHISEYLPDHWRARAWLSGFDGSAGTVVTETESGLWTDGIFIQAERQILAVRSFSTV
ncbi:MAG: aminopeptidase P family N-terminal domain-containing protein [Enterocloster sp.]